MNRKSAWSCSIREYIDVGLWRASITVGAARTIPMKTNKQPMKNITIERLIKSMLLGAHITALSSAAPLSPWLAFQDSPSRTFNCKSPSPRGRLQRIVSQKEVLIHSSYISLDPRIVLSACHLIIGFLAIACIPNSRFIFLFLSAFPNKYGGWHYYQECENKARRRARN